MGDSRLIVEEEDQDFPSHESTSPSPSLSLSTHFSSLMIDVDHRSIVSTKSFSYNRLPSEPFRLSVLKLDGSCFRNSLPFNVLSSSSVIKKSNEMLLSHTRHWMLN